MSHNATGSWPVMLTPFDEKKNIDWDAFDPLVEWYIAAGSQGLFACCISSEILNLSLDERLQLAQRTVRRTHGRIPVIAAGAFGDSPEQIVASSLRLAETGISGLVFLSNQFARKDEGDEVWLSNMERILKRLPDSFPLGLYESPVPYKRILSPQIAAWAAASGRFHFLKDTSSDITLIGEKIKALSGSPFHLYNANTPTLLDSLRLGAHGFSGVGSNLVPHLYAWLCENFEKEPDIADALQRFLVNTSPIVDLHYPHSAEAYMRRYGLPIIPSSRMVPQNTLTQSYIDRFEEFHRSVGEWEARLGIPSPFTLIK